MGGGIPIEGDSMRLTLRTLLAYLDNTLDPEDSEILRVKIQESNFASGLITRINDALANKTLAGIDPAAVGPLQDANAISEYLDSTLSAEQVAEIERACLDSETSLAEAAACHQVLTMVMATPSSVPESLRARVYGLPELQKPPAVQPGNFASVSVPEEPLRPPGANQATSVPPPVHAVAAELSADVPPVGPDDSGVRDAPSRMRDSVALDQGEPSGYLSAKQRAALHKSEVYGGTVRPSRITPWLVTLALTAALLFVVTQIFAPLLNRETAQQTDSDSGSTDLVPAAEDSGSASEESAEDADTVPNADADSQPGDTDTEPPARDSDDGNPDDMETSAADQSVMVPAELETEVKPQPESAAAPESTATSETPSQAETANGAEVTSNPPEMATDTATETPSPEAGEMEDSADAVQQPEAVTPEALAEPETSMAGAGLDPIAPEPSVAKLLGDSALVIGRGPDGIWGRMANNEMVPSNITMITPPMFRSTFSTASEVDVTMVGPANLAFSAGDVTAARTTLEFGTLLAESAQSDATLAIQAGDQALDIKFADPESVVAIELSYSRAPGQDPTTENSRIETLAIDAIAGDVLLQWTTDLGEPAEQLVVAGQQWTVSGINAPNIREVETAPAWSAPVPGADTTLEDSAREGILEFMQAGQPVEVSMNEAMRFRRAEVGALAAQTLLMLGRADVMFAIEGVFNQATQRFYWNDHLTLLKRLVNRGPDDAKQLLESIAQADQAGANAIQQMIIGYSQAQLAAGADQILVSHLTSESMALRVLAIENLREITGTTLNYKPGLTNASRRESDAKKWIARIRKGDIRWPAK